MMRKYGNWEKNGNWEKIIVKCEKHVRVLWDHIEEGQYTDYRGLG